MQRLNPRPFRFGLLGERVRSAPELVDTARRAEGAGFATFLLRDHFIEEPFGHQLAPLAALATAAAATTTLRVGSLVLCNDYRHPVLLAKEVATLDLVSGGRFELGLGAGFSRPEYEAAGLPFDPPGVRVGRLAEALQVVKGVLGAAPFTFAGRFYTVTRLEAFPKPVQQPHPPILIGAGGRRMLAIAAREADIIGIQTATVRAGRNVPDPSGLLAEAIEEKIGWIRQEAAARFDNLELSLVASVVITDHRREAAERLVRERGWDGLSPDRVFEMPSIFIGSVDQIADEMRGRRERYGISYYVVGDRSLEMLAPVVARLVGR
jgi:probable F420-dependent oxidoreductase